MIRSSFARKSGFFFVAANAGNFIQFSFQMVMGRMLTDGEFTLMNALFCMMSLAAVPANALQMDVSRRTALRSDPPDIGRGLQPCRRAFRQAIPFGILLALVIFFGRHWIADFLKTPDILAVSLTAAGTFLSLMMGISQGFFSGMRWFVFLGVLSLLLPVFRVGLAALLAWMGLGASAGIIGTASVALVPLAWIMALSWRFRSEEEGEPAESRREGVFWLAWLAIGINSTLTNVDLVLVKHLLPESEANLFASAGVFGRAMIFFLGPLGMALLPLSAVHASREEANPHQVFWQCLKLCLLLGAAAAAAGGLLSRWAFLLLEGKSAPAGAVELLRPYLWAMLPAALVTVTMNHLLAIKSWRLVGVASVLTGIYPLGIVCWHKSLYQVLMVNFSFGLLILLTLLWQLRRPPASPSAAPEGPENPPLGT